MRRVVITTAGALCALLVTGPRPAAADILLNVSKSAQRMSVLVDGTSRYNWPVSTGTKRYTTPSGVYKPQWLARKWRSKQYGNAPMPHSIFFHEGYAIHGTTELARLGKIASHGCVRLHPDNAAKLFELVQKQMANTRVVVSDDLIEAPGEAPKKKPGQFVAENATVKEPVIDADRKPAAKVTTSAAAVNTKPPRAATLLAENAPAKEPVVESKKTLATAVAPAAAVETKPPRAATLLAENAPAKEPGVESKKTLAMAPAPQAAAPENPPPAEKAKPRETSKPNPARRERIARAQSGGFHW